MYLPSNSTLTRPQSSMMDDYPAVFTAPIDLCFQASRASQISLLIRPANPRRQNLRVLTRFFPRLWGMDDVVTGRVVDHGRVQFLFPSQEALQLVLRRGPWSFNQWMVAMEAWNPTISNESPSSIDFWVQIRDIPLQFLSNDMVRFIAESLGPVVGIDVAALGENSIYGRVCIRWPLDRALIFTRHYQFGTESADVQFRYEKLQNHCFRCHSLQHDIDECEVPEEDAAQEHQDPDQDSDPEMLTPLDLSSNPATRSQGQNQFQLQDTGLQRSILALPSTSHQDTERNRATVFLD